MLQTTLKRIFKLQKPFYSFSPKNYFHNAEDAFFRQSFFKRSYTRPFTISSQDSLLSINCVKGKFKQQQDYIALDKMGIIILEFIPFKKGTAGKRSTIDPRLKKNFSLNLKNVGEILRLNPFDVRNGALKLDFNYFAGSMGEEKRLIIEKDASDDKINFNLTTMKNGSTTTSTMPIDLGDFIIIQELLKYSLPYMLGWHIMSSPRIAEEEYNSTPVEKLDTFN